jgi:hypothetical protein
MSYICGKKAYKIFNLLCLTKKAIFVKNYFYSYLFQVLIIFLPLFSIY